MSKYIRISDLTETFKTSFYSQLVITPSETKFGVGEEIECYSLFSKDEEPMISIPLYYFNKNRKSILDESSTSDDDDCIWPSHSEYKFTGKIRDAQKEIRDQSFSKLNKRGTLLLSLCTGGGKTVIGIYLMYKIGLKCCVLVHRRFLIEQWKERLSQFAPDAKIQIIHAKTKLDESADVYIMNIDNVHKKDYSFFSSIGTLIVDEAHLSCSPGRAKSYTRFSPKYLICLTATPDERSDNSDIQLFDMYVGKKNVVFKGLHRDHIVFRYNTGYCPKISYNRMGKLDWNDILNQQATNEKRNRSIIEVINKFSDINFIVLCKRIVQANYLHDSLKDAGQSVDIYTGEQKYFNFDTRVLVSSFSKCGTGFDWNPRSSSGEALDMGLIIASDVEAYFMQYLGRVFRSDKSPVIIDFVDKFGVMIKHWKTRCGVYENAGGKVMDYHLIHPQ